MAVATPPRPRSRRRLATVGAFAVLLALPPLYLWHASTAAERELDALLAETDRAEPGWRYDDLLARRKRVPDGRSAARQVERVTAAWKIPGDPPLVGVIGLLQPGDSLSAERLGELRAYLAAMDAARAEAFKLKDLPTGDFAPKENADGARLQEVRVVRLLLFLDAELRTHEGDGDGALDACRGAFHCVRPLGVGPWGHGQTWCRQFQPTTVAQLERVLARAEPSDAALERMQRCLEEELALSLRDALVGIRAKGWRYLEGVLAGGAPTMLHRPLPGPLAWAAPLLPYDARGDAIELLTGMNRFLAECDKGVEGRHDELLALTESWDKRSAAANLRARPGQAVWEHYWTQGTLRAALLGVVAKRYQLRHGAFPEAPEALVGEGLIAAVPADPCDGRPFGWERDAGGLTVRGSRYGTFRLFDAPAGR